MCVCLAGDETSFWDKITDGITDLEVRARVATLHVLELISIACKRSFDINSELLNAGGG